MLFNSLGLRERSFSEQAEWDAMCLAARKSDGIEDEPRTAANGYMNIRNAAPVALDLSAIDNGQPEPTKASIRNAAASLDLSLIDA